MNRAVEEAYFPCTMNSRMRTTSMAVVLIAAAVFLIPMAVTILSVMHLSIPPDTKATAVATSVAVTALVVILSISIATFAPKGYRVGPDGITVVRRNGRSFLIAKGDLSSAEEVGPEVLKWTIRTCGGSFFGNWGWFRSPALGSFRGYWVNRDSLVVVRSVRGRPVVLSPDARGEFVARVNETLGVAGRKKGT